MKYIKLFENYDNDYLKLLDIRYNDKKNEIPSSFKKDYENIYKKSKNLMYEMGEEKEPPIFYGCEYEKKLNRFILLSWERKIEKEKIVNKDNDSKNTLENNYEVSKYNSFRKNLNYSKEQLDAIKIYKNYGYENINNDLRNQNINKYIEILDSCFKYETDTDVIVCRLIENDEYLKKDFVEKAYLSTSCDLLFLNDEKDNYENPVILKLIIPMGIKYLKPQFAAWNDYEKEIIFERNLKLTYIEKEGDMLIYKVTKN